MAERKSILLTYGEMKDASKSDGYTGVARAQLKKVVEQLRSKTIKAWGGNRVILDEDWQALCKEVE